MAQLFGGDAGDQAVERLELGFAAEVEALEQVIAEGRHLAVFAAQQLLKCCRSIGISLFGRWQFGLQLVDAHEHLVGSHPGEALVLGHERHVKDIVPRLTDIILQGI